MPKRTAHILEDKWRSDDVKQHEAADFSSLLLSDRVLLGLKKAGFKTPSPIQLEAIPVGRFGSDLIVQAKSGTGKTLVFTIIALELIKDVKQPQVLILAPTREIAFQICDVVNSVSSGFKYLKCGAFIGGINIEHDRQNIQGCQIVVGTPGRIKQLLSLKLLHSNSIHLLVIDEADQLLDDTFVHDLNCIFVSLPKEKQVITTSATYPKTLKKLATKYFRASPFIARLNVNHLALLGTLHYIRIVEINEMPVLAYRAKMRALEDVLTSVNFAQCLVFCNAVSKVATICEDIKGWGFSATHISSAKDQVARLKAIECLKRFKCKVLVSSDVTSRGIDAENVDLIISIDLPFTTEIYLHRVGRAGRYGSKGLAVTFVSSDEVCSFKKIQLEGSFNSYFLPDPIPADLITKKPDPKSQLLKDKESVPESSDEEPSSESKTTINPAKHASNGSGKSARNNQKPGRKAELLTDEESVSESSDEEPSSESETTIKPAKLVSNGSRKGTRNNLKHYLKTKLLTNEESVSESSDEEPSSESKTTIKPAKTVSNGSGKSSKSNLKHYPKTELLKDEDSVSESSDGEPSSLDNIPSESITKINPEEHVCNDLQKSATINQKSDIKDDYEHHLSESNDMDFESFSSITGKSSAIKWNPDPKVKEISLEELRYIKCYQPLMGEHVSNGTERSATINQKPDPKAEYRESDAPSFKCVSLLHSHTDSCKDTLVDVMALEKTQDKDITENDSSSPESPNKYEIKEGLQLSQEVGRGEVVVPLTLKNEKHSETQFHCANEVLNEIINNANEVEVPVLHLDGKPTNPYDVAVDVSTVIESESNDGDNCKLNGNFEVKVEDLCQAVEQSSLDEENDVVFETSNMAVNPVQVDEVIACVVTSIHNYEKKKYTDCLNEDTVAVKPAKSNSSDPKSPIHEHVTDKNSLQDYCNEVLQAYRNENIEGDTSKILWLIEEADIMENAMSPINESEEMCSDQDGMCSNQDTETDVITDSNKIDLNSCSMELSIEDYLRKTEENNKIDLILIEESADSSTDCKFESTPLKDSKWKAKKAQLDVSSDTPSFLNHVDDPETEDSLTSRYSNKCSELENAFKNKMGTVNKGQEVASKHSADTESTSISSDSEGSTELTLLERAHRKMVETNNKEQTLGDKAYVLRKLLHGFGKETPSGQKSKESISDIQITTAAHSSKVNKSASNDDYLLHDNKTRKLQITSSFSLSSSLSREDLAKAKKSADSGCSSSKFRGKNVNSWQDKYRQFSSSSNTSSGDSESSYSSAAICTQKQKGLKAAKSKTHSKADKTPIQCHQETSARADQGNFNVHNPQYSSQVNGPYFNPQGDFGNGVHPTYQHGISSHMPSQHQCYSVDAQSSCQTQACAANCTEKQKRSKATKCKTHSRTVKTPIQRQQETFASAYQGNFNVHHPQNASQVNVPYFNIGSSVHPAPEHDISCYMPSQHQCYSADGQSFCGSPACAAWHDLFFRQWYFIQQASYFQ